LAMFLAGMGSMRGMQAHLMAQPVTSLEYVVMACLAAATIGRRRGGGVQKHGLPAPAGAP
jgi:hypothetical protein